MKRRTRNKKNLDWTIFKDNKEDTISFSFKHEHEKIVRLEKAKELILFVKEKYKLTFDELKSLLEEKLVSAEEISLPISIFNSKLTVLESTVKYLKEEKELSLRKISSVINRDERNIWHIFDNAKKKYPEKFEIKDVKLWIPVLIFSDSKLSALESLVVYLKEKSSFTYHEIAVLLERDDRTIWTVYSRARKKNAK